MLLYLLDRCVKGAVRYNKEGWFNQSPDKRRLGRSRKGKSAAGQRPGLGLRSPAAALENRNATVLLGRPFRNSLYLLHRV